MTTNQSYDSVCVPEPGGRHANGARALSPSPLQRQMNWALAWGRAPPPPRAERKLGAKSGPGGLEQVSLSLCPFPGPQRDKAERGAGLVSVWGLLFVLQEQQELFNSMAEWHIPTGSLIKNKTHNTVLQWRWLSPCLPLWTRRPLLLAFVPGSSWVASGGGVWRGKAVGWAGLDSQVS